MTRTFAPRPQSHSVTEMTEYVLPQHANAFGGVFGGQIMAWVDLKLANDFLELVLKYEGSEIPAGAPIFNSPH